MHAECKMIRSNIRMKRRKKKRNGTSAMVAPLELEEKAAALRTRASMLKMERSHESRGSDVWKEEDEDSDDEAITSPPAIDLESSPAARFLLQLRMPWELSNMSSVTSTTHMAAIPFLWEEQPGRPKQPLSLSPSPSPPPLDLIKLPSPSLSHIPLPPRLLCQPPPPSPSSELSLYSASVPSSSTSYVPSSSSSSSSPSSSSARKLNASVASLVNLLCRPAKAQKASCEDSDRSKKKKRKQTFPSANYNFHGGFRRKNTVNHHDTSTTTMSSMPLAESGHSCLLQQGVEGCTEESVSGPASSRSGRAYSDAQKVQSKRTTSKSRIPASETPTNRKKTMKEKEEKRKKMKLKMKRDSSFVLKLTRTGSRVIVVVYKLIRRVLLRKRAADKSDLLLSNSTMEYHNLH